MCIRQEIATGSRVSVMRDGVWDWDLHPPFSLGFGGFARAVHLREAGIFTYYSALLGLF